MDRGGKKEDNVEGVSRLLKTREGEKRRRRENEREGEREREKHKSAGPCVLLNTGRY